MNSDRRARDGGRHGGSRYYDDRREDRFDERRDHPRDRRRRSRSRSPARRMGRREYEMDTYSSSRDYREREREEFARRRDDRGWDRDRDRRRDPRRDDDDRRMRRDRDGMDERGGRGRRDGRDARDGREAREARDGRERRRSPSPFKKREATPDLTSVMPIMKRPRRMTQWDIKPVGYEPISAEQAKLSGMFPLPGAPRTQAMDPSRLQAFMNQPTSTASASALKPSNSKQAKRLFVHNIAPNVHNQSLADFFNLQMNGTNVVSGTDPCLLAQIASDHSYAVVEFKTAEDATYALALDGVGMDGSEMTDNPDRPGLSIRRPKDYIAPAVNAEDGFIEGQVSDKVPEGPQKLCITGIPLYFNAEQLMDLLATMGPMKSYTLVSDGAGQSRGIVFCEYVSQDSMRAAVDGFSGMELGDGRLRVTTPCTGITQASGLEAGVNAVTVLANTRPADALASRVVMFLNMVTPEELMDQYEYEGILEDVHSECEAFGEVLEVKIPRPAAARTVPGVGKIYVKFIKAEAASQAISSLGGRKFSGRTVVATHYSEENFDVGAW